MCSIKHILVITSIQNTNKNNINLFWIVWIKGRNDKTVVKM